MVTCAPERVAQLVSGAIGILGGTFDPVHHGHLRLALEVREALGLTEVRLIPTASTHLRTTATASPEQRLTMLTRAVAPGLVVDDRELVRGGRSYTIDTPHFVAARVSQRTAVLHFGRRHLECLTALAPLAGIAGLRPFDRGHPSRGDRQPNP